MLSNLYDTDGRTVGENVIKQLSICHAVCNTQARIMSF